jgi:hypothetical protein
MLRSICLLIVLTACGIQADRPTLDHPRISVAALYDYNKILVNISEQLPVTIDDNYENAEFSKGMNSFGFSIALENLSLPLSAQLSFLYHPEDLQRSKGRATFDFLKSYSGSARLGYTWMYKSGQTRRFVFIGNSTWLSDGDYDNSETFFSHCVSYSLNNQVIYKEYETEPDNRGRIGTSTMPYQMHYFEIFERATMRSFSDHFLKRFFQTGSPNLSADASLGFGIKRWNDVSEDNSTGNLVFTSAKSLTSPYFLFGAGLGFNFLVPLFITGEGRFLFTQAYEKFEWKAQAGMKVDVVWNKKAE